MKTHFYKGDILKICHKWHITASEIYEKISQKHPSASQSSIYRNIDDMVQKWELKKLEWVGKKAYFETNIWNHIHLIDRNTWEIVDVDMDDIDLNIPNLPKNFITDSLDIKIFWEFSSQ